MDTGAIDFVALALALSITLAIVVALAWADRDAIARRSWLTAAALAAILITIGLVEILTARPREVHVATVLVGASLPILSALGLIRATRRMKRQWLRWPIIYLTTLALLFAGLIIGAAMVPKYLGS
jgi:energy-converting hydrogenase Eha subunit A